MNWSGAKNWLIVLFLGINIFLVFTLIKINTQSSVIDRQTIEDTAQILQKSNITVSADTIPDSLPKLGAIDVYNSVSDTDELAKKILGESYGKLSEHTYILGSKRLGFDGDMIYFANENPSESIEIKDISGAQSYVTKLFREYGFNMDGAITSGDVSNGIYNVYVTQKIDRYALIDSYFNVKLNENGIHSFEGSWFSPSGGQGMFSSDSARARSIITVLFEFARDGVRENAGSNEIVHIDLGYITGDKQTYHKHSTAMPMWHIRTSDGKEYYYDAI